jgi:DNA-binding MarR family transcriptional regulator
VRTSTPVRKFGRFRRLLDVHRTDVRLLDVLHMAGGMSAGELARAGHLSPAAVTAALDRLERAGYVRRVRDREDRRRVLVEVTDRMHKLTEELYGPLAESGDRLLDGYSDDVLRALREILDRAAELQLEQAERVTERVDARPPTGSRRGR